MPLKRQSNRPVATSSSKRVRRAAYTSDQDVPSMPGSMPDPVITIQNMLGPDFPLAYILAYNYSNWGRYFYIEIFHTAHRPSDGELSILRHAFDQYLGSPNIEVQDVYAHPLARYLMKSHADRWLNPHMVELLQDLRDGTATSLRVRNPITAHDARVRRDVQEGLARIHELRESLACNVCLEEIQQPWVGPCGHMCCTTCRTAMRKDYLKRLLKKQEDADNHDIVIDCCQICRFEIPSGHDGRCLLVVDLLASLNVSMKLAEKFGKALPNDSTPSTSREAVAMLASARVSALKSAHEIGTLREQVEDLQARERHARDSTADAATISVLSRSLARSSAGICQSEKRVKLLEAQIKAKDDALRRYQAKLSIYKCKMEADDSETENDNAPGGPTSSVFSRVRGLAASWL